MKPLVGVSIMDFDVLQLAEEVQSLLLAGVDFICLTVDGNPYPEKYNCGPKVCSNLCESGVHCPIHLEIKGLTPIQTIESFAKAGVESISICLDSVIDVNNVISLIKSVGCEAGLIVNQNSILNASEADLNRIDFLHVSLSYNEEKKLSEDDLEKIVTVSEFMSNLGKTTRLEIFGENYCLFIKGLSNTGANAFVIDKYAFMTRITTQQSVVLNAQLMLLSSRDGSR